MILTICFGIVPQRGTACARQTPIAMRNSRFVSRKLGIMPSKRESLSDLYRLIQWNHKYDADNLKRAIDFIRDFEHKLVTCRCADDLVAHVTKRSPDNALSLNG
jgi:hypothetical protein